MAHRSGGPDSSHSLSRFRVPSPFPSYGSYHTILLAQISTRSKSKGAPTCTVGILKRRLKKLQTQKEHLQRELAMATSDGVVDYKAAPPSPSFCKPVPGTPRASDTRCSNYLGSYRNNNGPQKLPSASRADTTQLPRIPAVLKYAISIDLWSSFSDEQRAHLAGCSSAVARGVHAAEQLAETNKRASKVDAIREGLALPSATDAKENAGGNVLAAKRARVQTGAATRADSEADPALLEAKRRKSTTSGVRRRVSAATGSRSIDTLAAPVSTPPETPSPKPPPPTTSPPLATRQRVSGTTNNSELIDLLSTPPPTLSDQLPRPPPIAVTSTPAGGVDERKRFYLDIAPVQPITPRSPCSDPPRAITSADDVFLNARIDVIAMTPQPYFQVQYALLVVRSATAVFTLLQIPGATVGMALACTANGRWSSLEMFHAVQYLLAALRCAHATAVAPVVWPAEPPTTLAEGSRSGRGRGGNRWGSTPGQGGRGQCAGSGSVRCTSRKGGNARERGGGGSTNGTSDSRRRGLPPGGCEKTKHNGRSSSNGSCTDIQDGSVAPSGEQLGQLRVDIQTRTTA